MTSTTRPADRPPLPVGSTIDAGFALLRRNPRPLLLPQLLLQCLPFLAGIVIGAIAFLLIGDVDKVTETIRQSEFLGDSTIVEREVTEFTDGQYVVLGAAFLVWILFATWCSVAAATTVVRGADRALGGEPPLSVGEAVREGLQSVPKMFGLWIAFYLLCAGLVLGAAVLVFIGMEISAMVGAALGVAAALVGTWLLVRWSLWPIAHLTDTPGFRSWSRSRELTRGRFWPLLGIIGLASVVVGVVYMAVAILAELLLSGAFTVDEVAGFAALAPYFVAYTLMGVAMIAAFLAPMVVAHRTLVGDDVAGLRSAAEQMAYDSDAYAAFGTPAPVTGWAPQPGVGGAPSPAGDGAGLGRTAPDAAAPPEAESPPSGGSTPDGGSASGPSDRDTWGRPSADA